jgi:CRISPR-associated protein Csb2
LHSALLCAAGFGSRAVPHDNGLVPCAADEAALRWLEEHPPDSVAIPPLAVNLGRAVAYRDDGTIKQARGRATTKKLPKVPDRSVGVGGRFVWMWTEPPPLPVRQALTALCGDVPYLGTTESPVRLTVTEPVAPTHEADRRAGMFPDGGVTVEVCRPGRTRELAAAHVRRMVVPRSESRAGYGTDESSLSETPTREAVEPLHYRSRAQPVAADVPWGQVVLVPLSRAVAEPYRVAWAVAAHRALIKLIGDGAPPLVTGAYPTGMPRPANRVALHLLDGSAPVAGGHRSPGTLAILVPGGAQAADVAVLLGAVGQLRAVRGPGGKSAGVVGQPWEVSGARFWAETPPGCVRLWRTVPAAVPDTRGVRGREWTFTEAALLSVGFVWKRLLPAAAGRGEEHYRNLAGSVAEAGVAVVRTAPVRTVEVGRYVHRVNEHAVVRPYTAWLWLGDLAPATAVAAIGQSRHLGGGLLVPHDMPAGTPLDAVGPVGGPAVPA